MIGDNDDVPKTALERESASKLAYHNNPERRLKMEDGRLRVRLR
jgi:hypothetical protein